MQELLTDVGEAKAQAAAACRGMNVEELQASFSHGRWFQ